MSDRRPLVLTVYDLDAFPHLVAKARGAGRAKRLTDAELAAEYHSQCVDERMALAPPRYGGCSCHSAKDYARIEQIALTLWRFATHPHYDERRTDA